MARWQKREATLRTICFECIVNWTNDKLSFGLDSNAEGLLIKQKSEGKCRFGSHITQLVSLEREYGNLMMRAGKEGRRRILLIFHRKRDSIACGVSIKNSGALTTDSAGKLHILGHDGNSLGVDGAEVGVFEETDHVGLGGLLEGEDSGGLETELVSVLRSDFSDESLERQFSNEELGGFLETSDLTESDGTGSESVGFLDTVGG